MAGGARYDETASMMVIYIFHRVCHLAISNIHLLDINCLLDDDVYFIIKITVCSEFGVGPLG